MNVNVMKGGFVFRSLCVGRVKYPEGTVNDHQLAFYDLMPTFCDLAGVKNYVKKYTNKKKTWIILMVFLLLRLC